MYTYRVIPDGGGMPEMGELRPSYEGRPSARGDVFRITFETPLEVAMRSDTAVGRRCRVLRSDEQGNTEEATGAIDTNSPLTVSLDGKGWSYCAYIYPRFGAITDAQRGTVLTRLKSMMSAEMTFLERSGEPCIRVETQSDDAALVAVNVRLARIRSELGLEDDQLTCGLGPRL